LRRADDPRGLLGPAAADVEGQDHRLHGGHRQGRRRPPDGGHREVGPRPLLLHRGRLDDPAHLHPRDPARVQGVAGRAAGRASAGHEAIQDIDWKEAPPLGGYVATTIKGSADLVLMTHQEDPLLATWRYGLGRSAAFTSDAKAKWGVLWVRWPAFNKFWSQVTRWTLRTGTRSDTVATVSRADDVGEVLVDAIDPKGEFINFLDSQVGVVSPDKQRTGGGLEQIAPRRYRRRLPPAQEGVYLVGMAQGRADQMVGSQLAGLVVPYGQEFRDLGVDEALLRELSE